MRKSIPLLAKERWRDSLIEAGAPGWSGRLKRFAEVLLRLRPIGLALRATPVCAASPLAVDAATLEASSGRARASRPPLRGGECLLVHINFFCPLNRGHSSI